MIKSIIKYYRITIHAKFYQLKYPLLNKVKMKIYKIGFIDILRLGLPNWQNLNENFYGFTVSNPTLSWHIGIYFHLSLQ